MMSVMASLRTPPEGRRHEVDIDPQRHDETPPVDAASPLTHEGTVLRGGRNT
jgi:hypothetical protein